MMLRPRPRRTNRATRAMTWAKKGPRASGKSRTRARTRTASGAMTSRRCVVGRASTFCFGLVARTMPDDGERGEEDDEGADRAQALGGEQEPGQARQLREVEHRRPEQPGEQPEEDEHPQAPDERARNDAREPDDDPRDGAGDRADQDREPGPLVPLPFVSSAYRSGDALRNTARRSTTDPSRTRPVRNAPMIAPTKAPATTDRTARSRRTAGRRGRRPRRRR